MRTAKHDAFSADFYYYITTEPGNTKRDLRPGQHMVAVSLILPPPGDGKMRDPGNEVDAHSILG